MVGRLCKFVCPWLLCASVGLAMRHVSVVFLRTRSWFAGQVEDGGSDRLEPG